jgi:hypothetical protein
MAHCRQALHSVDQSGRKPYWKLKVWFLDRQQAPAMLDGKIWLLIWISANGSPNSVSLTLLFK